MKNLLLTVTMFLASVAAKAQATEIYYFNHNPVPLVVHLEDNRSCGIIISTSLIPVPPAPGIPGYNHYMLGVGPLAAYPSTFFSIVGVTVRPYGISYTVGEPNSTICGTPTGFPYWIGGGGPGAQDQVSFNFPSSWGPNIVDLRDY